MLPAANTARRLPARAMLRRHAVRRYPPPADDYFR